MIEITIIDRFTASASGMAGALYVLSASLLWWVLITRKKAAAVTPLGTQSVIVDRAIAWSALAVLFSAIAVSELGWVDWRELGPLFLMTTLVIMIAGLFSVRAITQQHLGNKALVVFIAVIAATGLSLWLWG